jgi:hypothetical protein
MTITVRDVTPYDIVHGTGMAGKRETSALKMETTLARNGGIYTKLHGVILQKVIILLFHQTHWKSLMFMVSEILPLI